MSEIYTEETKHKYRVPPCPLCGASGEVSWVDIREMADPPDVTRLIPGYRRCSDSCGEQLDPFEREKCHREHLGWRFER